MKNLIENNNPIGAIDPALTKKAVEQGKKLATRFAKDPAFRKKVVDVASKIKRGKKVEKTINKCTPKLQTDNQTGIDIPPVKIEKSNNTTRAKEGDKIKILTGSNAGKSAIVNSVKGEDKFELTIL